jgi:peptidyl-prolyl cis-trans isomerase D
MEDGGRILFRVVGASVPTVDLNAPALAAISGQLKDGFADDVLAQYLAKLENDLGIKINVQAFAAAVGASPDAY